MEKVIRMNVATDEQENRHWRFLTTLAAGDPEDGK